MQTATQPPETDAPKAPTTDIAELVELTDRKRELEQELSGVKKRIDAIEPLVAQWMIETGVQNIGLGDKTVYQRIQTGASVKPEFKREAVAAARKLGLEDLIVLQPQSLASYCREMLQDPGSELPIELRDLVNVYETTRVSIRKS